MPESYHGFLVPSGAVPADKVSTFLQCRAHLRAYPDCTVRGMLHCVGTDCLGISCRDCLFGLDTLCTWRDIAKFHAYEQWLRENNVLPESYCQRPIVGPGGIIIGSNLLLSIFLSDLLRCWDSGSVAYCTGVACAPGGCDKCICCSNHGDRRQKLEAFYQYATALGFALQDRSQEGEACESATLVAETTGNASAEIAGDSAAVLQPSGELPDNCPKLSNWTKALAKYNRGFVCWCDALDKNMQCPDAGCVGCFCSMANPGAEESFGAWAREQGWDVTRGAVQDVYTAPRRWFRAES